MRIKSVTRVSLAVPVPVYDVTVKGPENFKLFNGPYVHNSKDVSDSLAGVVYGLTTRREVWGMFNIPVMRIPESIKQASAKTKEMSQEKEAA